VSTKKITVSFPSFTGTRGSAGVLDNSVPDPLQSDSSMSIINKSTSEILVNFGSLVSLLGIPSSSAHPPKNMHTDLTLMGQLDRG